MSLGFNNKRRSTMYWFSLVLLLENVFNIAVVLGDGVISHFVNILYNFFVNIIPYLDGYSSEAPILLILMILLIVIVIGIIMLSNTIIGKIEFKCQTCNKLLRFVYRPEFMMDGFLGVILSGLAINGFHSLALLDRHISIQTVLYLGILISGIGCYWYSVFPFFLYKKSVEALAKVGENIMDVWYLISNSNTIVSSFEQIPIKKNRFITMVDKVDIDHINEKGNGYINIEKFTKCIAYFDPMEEKNSGWWDSLETVLHIPHIQVVVFYHGEENIGKRIEEQIRNRKLRTVKLIPLNGSVHEDIFAICENLKTYDFLEKNYKGNPIEDFQDSRLQSHYINLWKGPQISFDFLLLCMNTLEVMPAIYALFDFMDLQYRICLAFISSKEDQWYSSISKKIGNINEMATILYDEGIFFDTTVYFEKKVVFHDSDIELIKKYLPNYKIVERYCYTDIIYVSRQLRNVLRGHGSFDKNHAILLYKLIFRLALMTSFILKMNDKNIEVTHELQNIGGFYRIRGTMQSMKRELSPFLLGTKNNSILVFNNWQHGVFEYINYLDGSLVLPSVISVPSCEIKD